MNSADKSPKTSADEGDQLKCVIFTDSALKISPSAITADIKDFVWDFAGLHQGLGVTASYVSLKLVLGQDSARRIGFARCFSWRRSIKMLLGWILIRLKNAWS